jgi:hypothetical protein
MSVHAPEREPTLSGVGRLLARPGTWASLVPPVAIGTAALYGIGFVVVSAALARYGVRELEAIRPRYVAVGLAFALVTMAALLSARWTVPLAARLARRQGWRRIFGLAGAFAFLAADAYALAFIEQNVLLQVQAVPYESLQSWDGWLGVLAPLGRFNTLILMIIVFLRRAGWHRALSLNTILDYNAVLALGLALGAILSYATTVFTILPIWLGGGHLETIHLEMRTPLECAACSGPLGLVDEDNVRVVVLTAEGIAVEVARGEIRALIHR